MLQSHKFSGKQKQTVFELKEETHFSFCYCFISEI